MIDGVTQQIFPLFDSMPTISLPCIYRNPVPLGTKRVRKTRYQYKVSRKRTNNYIVLLRYVNNQDIRELSASRQERPVSDITEGVGWINKRAYGKF
jgi:hypothetical protein